MRTTAHVTLPVQDKKPVWVITPDIEAQTVHVYVAGHRTGVHTCTLSGAVADELAGLLARIGFIITEAESVKRNNGSN